VRCGEVLRQPGAVAPPVSIPSYLAQAILVTLFCWLPFGIVAIVYAAQVGGKAAAGDIQGAMDASGKARMWAWISFGIGLAWVAVYLLFLVVSVVANA